MDLNAQQREAVRYAGHSVIVACPGSGKTRVLIEKAAHILERIPSSRIIVVTFTREAAQEVRNRLKQRVPSELGRIQAETFHALAIRHVFAAGLFQNLLGPGQQAALMRRAWNHACADLPWDDFVRAVEARASGRPLPPPAPTFDEAFDHYLGLLEHHSAVDFGQVIVQAVQRMRAGTLAPLPCTHLLLDEVQDVDPLQLDWAFVHAEKGAALTLVGDDDQSIYGWRGALGYDAVKRAMAHIRARLLFLEVNYRSRAEILGLAARLIRANQSRVAKQLHSHRGPGGRVALQPAGDSQREVEQIVQTVRSDPGEWAILARSNFKLDEVERGLVVAGVPYSRPGKASFWEAEGPSLLLALLTNPHAPDLLTLTSALAHCGVPETDIPRVTAGGVLDVPARQASVDFVTPDRVRSLQRVLRSIANAPANDAIKLASDWLLQNRSQRAAPAPAIQAAAHALRSLSGTLIERLRFVRHQKPDREGAGVTLATFHGAKGREWKRVVVCGLIEGLVPSRKAESIEEERRLLYVAMTRAEDELVLTFPFLVVQESFGRIRRMQATPSRFLTMDLGIDVNAQARVAAAASFDPHSHSPS